MNTPTQKCAFCGTLYTHSKSPSGACCSDCNSWVYHVQVADRKRRAYEKAKEMDPSPEKEELMAKRFKEWEEARAKF